MHWSSQHAVTHAVGINSVGTATAHPAPVAAGIEQEENEWEGGRRQWKEQRGGLLGGRRVHLCITASRGQGRCCLRHWSRWTRLWVCSTLQGPRAERIAILSHCRDQHIAEEAWVESVALRGRRAGTTELSMGWLRHPDGLRLGLRVAGFPVLSQALSLGARAPSAGLVCPRKTWRSVRTVSSGGMCRGPRMVTSPLCLLTYRNFSDRWGNRERKREAHDPWFWCHCQVRLTRG